MAVLPQLSVLIVVALPNSILLGGTLRASDVEGGRASVDSRFGHRLANTRGIGSIIREGGIILVNAAIHNTLEFNKHGKLGILALL